MHLNLGQNHKLRVANALNDLVLALTQPWVMCTLTHGGSHMLRFAIISDDPKNGYEKSNVENKRLSDQER